MNEVTRTAAELAGHGWAPGIMTAIFLAFFVGVFVWAYHPRMARAHEAAGHLPLEES